MDHYQTLGISRDATPEEIKAAYRRASAEHHPDREGGDTQRMQSINAAYGVLSDPVRRAEYDDPITSKAEAVLRARFGQAIDKDLEPIRCAGEQIAEGLKGVTKAQAEAERRLVVLQRRSQRTKAKGVNLVQEIIERKIADQHQILAECAETFAVANCALDMLKAYEPDPEHTPPDNRTPLQKAQQRVAYEVSQ